ASLCIKGILLKNGKIDAIGYTKNVIAKYNLRAITNKGQSSFVLKNSQGINEVNFFSNGVLTSELQYNANLRLQILFNSTKSIENPVLGLLNKNAEGEPKLNINNLHYSSSKSSTK